MECESRDKSILPCRYFVKPMNCALDHNFLCIEAKRRKAPRISYSELATYGKCYRMWWLKYGKGIERIKIPIRMLAGRIFGECLDQILSVKPTSSYQAILTDYRIQYENDEGEIPREILVIEGFMQALSEMEFVEDRGIPQYEFLWKELEYPEIHGFLDFVRLDGDGKPAYGKEFKYTTNLDNWSKFIVSGQIGTYFLGVPVDRIELVLFKVPGLKWIRKGKNAETGEQFRERIYKEVKFNKMEFVHKINYWRNEFQLDEVKERYRVMCIELYERLEKGEKAFWQTDNRSVCFSCEYLDICANDGVVSEQLYRKKERKEVENGQDTVGQG